MLHPLKNRWTVFSLAIITVFISGGFSGIQAADQSAILNQSFSQYFSPQILRAMDNLMKARNYEPLGHWKIWTDGFNRKYKGSDKKVEVILNWDGNYYIKNTEPEITGSWTQFNK